MPEALGEEELRAGLAVPGTMASAISCQARLRGESDESSADRCRHPRIEIGMVLAAPSSKGSSTGTSSAEASSTSTSSPQPPASQEGRALHRIDAEEFYRMLNGVVIDNTQLFNDKLQEWEDFYNFHRPRASSMDRPPTNGYDRRLRQTTRPHRAEPARGRRPCPAARDAEMKPTPSPRLSHFTSCPPRHRTLSSAGGAQRCQRHVNTDPLSAPTRRKGSIFSRR